MGEIKATPYARKMAAQYHIDIEAVEATGAHGEITSRDVERTRAGRLMAREVPVTPLAVRIAEARHIDLSRVRGTGIGGKISKADVLRATGRIEPELKPGERREVLTGMRRIIADRMTEAAQIPTCTVTTKADVTDLIEVREAFNSSHDEHYSINDLVLYAVVRALREDRTLLCSYDSDSVIIKDAVNLGVATAVEGGLLVPVVKDADVLTLQELRDAVKGLVKRARQKTLMPDELKGNTFTVTNLGMYGVEAFTPLINPPDAGILGICAVTDGVKVTDGQLSIRSFMRLSLTFDHRLINGAEAAAFNLLIKRYLEDKAFWEEALNGK